MAPIDIARSLNPFGKYGFLLAQLIGRDFKTRYRRSVLGVLWSVLNPLLTMTVQYLVFSQLFRFDIPYYAVYLLIGIIMFSFLSDASSQAMTSIVSNASLLNKVKVPRLIYPVSRILSSGVNFAFSLLALYCTIALSRLPVGPAHLLLLYDILCLYIFLNGIGFFLASIMVFFRDTQFLYGVVLTIWTYLTPVFYPESILPDAMKIVLRFNPMYHYIRFARTIILQGIVPSLQAWFFCAVFALLSFTIGYITFRRSENRFLLHL